jgi:hypothetical protein
MCGSPLVAETTVAREERKVVTVLFADLVGFTARAEQLDPEDVRALLAPYHARLRDELERHGGTVETSGAPNSAMTVSPMNFGSSRHGRRRTTAR